MSTQHVFEGIMCSTKNKNRGSLIISVLEKL